MSNRQFGVWVFLVAVVPICVGTSALAAQTQFDFTADDLSATFGPGTLDYFNGATTAGDVAFGTASSFGLPAMPGGDSGVMKFAAFRPDQGIQFDTGVAANGGGSYVNQYTMIWDLLVPNVAASPYMALLQTNPDNSNDGDFFIRADPRGIGISGEYAGTINDNQWHRIAASFDLTTGTLNKYIDGALVGTQSLGSGVDGRWSLDPTGGVKPLLFTDDDGETNSGYLSSFYFVDQALNSEAILALGGPNAKGIVPEPSTLALLGVGAVGIAAIAWRRREKSAQ
jgi:hypothetical protein